MFRKRNAMGNTKAWSILFGVRGQGHACVYFRPLQSSVQLAVI